MVFEFSASTWEMTDRGPGWASCSSRIAVSRGREQRRGSETTGRPRPLAFAEDEPDLARLRGSGGASVASTEDGQRR